MKISPLWVIWAFAVFIMLGAWAGFVICEQEMRVQAVKLGHGEWKVDERGRTTFAWKTIENK